MATEHHKLAVVGMSCEHCRCRVQRALEGVPGVVAVVIDLETGAADVEAETEATSREVLIAAVEDVGYEVGTMSSP